MNLISDFKYYFIVFISIITRFIPFPTKTGLYTLGNPKRDSPVILTGNYILTVAVVKKALRGIDAYLIVSNSRGINVWCAATGGHFTNHSIISSLKVTNIESLVDHKNVILPQLAATGIERKEILKHTGWKITWGPVDIHDLPKFIENNYNSTTEMRMTKFKLKQRIELGLTWAIFLGIIIAIVMLLFKVKIIIDLLLLFLIVTVVIYGLMPIYLNEEIDKKQIAQNMDLIRRVLIQAVLITPFVFIYYWILTLFKSVPNTEIYSLIGFSVLALIIHNVDLLGMTPIYKSNFLDKGYDVIIDQDKCRGAAYCETVCPRNCFVVDMDIKKATSPNSDSCVQCGACIVQCPFDALHFENSKHEIIEPEIIRTYKLNLMGERKVKT